MTKDDDDFEFRETEGIEPRARKKQPVLAAYEVGYGKPPVRSRFKKGQSGNPRGKPKGAVTRLPTHLQRLQETFMAKTEEKVAITRGGKTVLISKIDFIMQSMIDGAVKGDPRLMKFVMSLNIEIEKDKAQRHGAIAEAALKYKDDMEFEIASRKKHKMTGLPDILPHPDHVLIGRYGDVRIVGPLNAEEKKEDDAIEAQRSQWTERLQAIYAEAQLIIKRFEDQGCDEAPLLEKLRKLGEEKDALKEQLRRTDRLNRYP